MKKLCFIDCAVVVRRRSLGSIEILQRSLENYLRFRFTESMNLSKRLAQKAVKGQIILSNIDKRFPSFFDRLDSRNSYFSSVRSFGSESHQLP